MRGFIVLLLWLSYAGSLYAQTSSQDSEEVKKRILEKVAEKLKRERTIILEKIAKIIDEELAKTSKAEPDEESRRTLKDLEGKLSRLEKERQGLQVQMILTKRKAEDAKLVEAVKQNPLELQEAQKMFDEALTVHSEEKDFDRSIRQFKRIFYSMPAHQLGYTSAYNIACGCSLKEEKEAAIDWLQIAIHHGFAKYDHVKQDTDLDALRNEPRFKEIMRRVASE